MKKFIVGILTFVSLSSFAGERCESALYSSVLANYARLEQGYTIFYDRLNSKMANVCLETQDQDTLKNSCKKFCDSDAEGFHKELGTRFRFSKKVETLKSECREMCDLAAFKD